MGLFDKVTNKAKELGTKASDAINDERNQKAAKNAGRAIWHGVKESAKGVKDGIDKGVDYYHEQQEINRKTVTPAATSVSGPVTEKDDDAGVKKQPVSGAETTIDETAHDDNNSSAE